MTPPNEDTKTLDPCPPEEFLQAYATGKIKDKSLQSVILSHLEFCPSCQEQVRELKRAMSSGGDPIARRAQALQELQLAHQKAVKQGPTQGTMWRTLPESEKVLFGPLVLVIDRQEAKGEMSLTVAEVSEDVAQAIYTDMVLEPKESGLRFRCMIRAGNIFKTRPDRLTSFAGALSPSLMKKVQALCKEAERFDENIPLSKFVFLKDAQGTELMRRRDITSGMLVTNESDPRLEFLESSKEKCSYLSGKPVTTSKSESKVIALPTRQRLGRTILAIAAVLATVVVTWTGSQIVSDRSMKQLKAEHAKQVEELKGQFGTTAEEKAKELAGLHQEGEALKSKITALEGQNAELKNEMNKMAGSITQAEKRQVSARDEVGSVKSEMAKIESENAELKKKNMELAASNYESGRQLAEAREALQKLETKIAAGKEPQTFAGAEAIPIDPGEGKAVLEAAKSGDLAALRRLVKGWRSDDFSDQEIGTHAFLLAAFNGHSPVVKFLLDEGASVNASDADGKTALILAATKGYRDMVELLLKRGANPMLSDKGGKTALYWAMANGHHEIAEILRSSVK